MEQNNIPKKDWLSIQEVTEEYGLSKSMQAQYRMEKKIPYTKLGRKILYSREKINEWLKSLEVQR